MKQFLKNNYIFFAYAILSIILELSSLFVISKTIFIRQPWLSLLSFISIFSIYNLISSLKFKKILLNCVFVLQFVINLFCVILFENTGTVFDFSMLELATETGEFISTISFNYLYIAGIVVIFSIYLVATSLLSKFYDASFRWPYRKITCSFLLIISLISQSCITYYNSLITEKRFINNLYKSTNEKYNNLGITSSFSNELIKMLFFNNYNDLSYEEIEDFIYKETSAPTEYFGISEGNNLVTILVESFEWFSFISDETIYPNGANLSEDKLDTLFPNLRAFYNSSIVMNNHHSQNKTDISENESLLGMHPSSGYISYGFPKTTVSSSLANLLKIQDASISNSYFHSNYKEFYNRENVISYFGYENTYFLEEMVKEGHTNYLNEDTPYMNLDSETIEVMKDYMFPTDKRFNTHFTTISMHGDYEYNKNLQRWYDKMDSLNVVINNDDLKNYLAAVMEFDCALGLIIEDLTKKGLLENTTIVIFADHNAYMEKLTYFVKDMEREDYHKENYTELFRVPFMIYDDHIGHKIINKFTTTVDIVPTILDLFGIKYFSNLYSGNSIFSDETSLLYSKAFDIFVYDGLFYSNINKLLFKREDITNDLIKEVEEKSLELLEKIYYFNHIFEYNYFKNETNYNKFINKMQSINGFHN